MSQPYPRPLRERERVLVDLLLSPRFPGVEELRVQAQSIRVRSLWPDLPASVHFEVTARDAPRAEVVHTVPVEARVRDADPPCELLLFVKNGWLDSIELVSYGGAEPIDLPAPADLEAVQTTPAGAIVPDWVAQWLNDTGTALPDQQLAFLRDVDTYLRGSLVWRDEAGRQLERLMLEGPAGTPRIVIYLRSPRRPGLRLAFEYPLRAGEGSDDWAVLLANLMENLDEAGSELPTEPGDDGVARF